MFARENFSTTHPPPPTPPAPAFADGPSTFPAESGGQGGGEPRRIGRGWGWYGRRVGRGNIGGNYPTMLNI